MFFSYIYFPPIRYYIYVYIPNIYRSIIICDEFFLYRFLIAAYRNTYSIMYGLYYKRVRKLNKFKENKHNIYIYT